MTAIQPHPEYPLDFPLSSWPSDPGVYFVRAHDRIKIGMAKNIRKRLTELQTSAPYELQLLAVVAGSRAREYGYHRQFAAHRRIGEWFDMADPIKNEIRRLRQGPLRPDEHMPG